MWKEITIEAYVYVFIVKKLKENVNNSKFYLTANVKTKGPCWHYIAHLSARAHTYTHLRHEESKENLTAGLGRIFWSFCLIILRNISMLNQLPSSKYNSLNHVLDWEKVFEQCKTHQDNYSDKDSKCNLQCVIKIFLHLAKWPIFVYPIWPIF